MSDITPMESGQVGSMSTPGIMVHYPDAGTPDPPDDPSVGALAQAVDAVIDAVGDALEDGDLDQATALLIAADATSDALLEALGVPDADSPEDSD